MIEFDKSKIWFGMKKRFLKISKDKYFCFYDGFGSMGGKIVKSLSSDYKNAPVYDVENIMDEIQREMSYHNKKIMKLIKNKDKE